MKKEFSGSLKHSLDDVILFSSLQTVKSPRVEEKTVEKWSCVMIMKGSSEISNVIKFYESLIENPDECVDENKIRVWSR